MIFMKRYISMLLMFFIIASSLFACAPADKGHDTQTEALTEAQTDIQTDAETDASTAVAIVENGASDFAIVFSEKLSPDAISASDMLCEAIYKLTGVSLQKMSDTQAKKHATDTTRFILIGDTCFEQSDTAASQLSTTAEAYAAECFEEHIAIVSLYDAALIAAVSYYIEELMGMSYNDASNTLYFEDFYYDGITTVSSAFSLKKIDRYSIVYSTKVAGFDIIAESYRKAILELTGVSLPIYKDTATSEAPFEILLGYTNRELSEKCFASSSRIMSYEVIVENANMQIAAGGPYSAKRCLWDMQKTLFPFLGDFLGKGSYMSTDLAPVSPALTNGADLRIMSSNILAESASTEHVLPVSERVEIYCGVLLRYLPDAVGVQEADAAWVENIPKYLKLIEKLDGIKYSYILGTYLGSPQWEPIIYRSDLYSWDLASYSPAPYWTQTTRYLRGVSKAKFTSLSDPSVEFAIVNAHWNHSKESYMYSDATQMAKAVKELQQQYPEAMIFCTGDFNSHYYETKPLYQLLNDVSGYVCSELAKANGTLMVPCGCRVHGGHQNMKEGVTRPYDSDFIDHVIGVGDFEVLRHDTIIVNCANVMTDHSAIYADIRLK